MSDVPRLTDGPVVLRALDQSDLQGVVEQCQDPRSILHTTVPVPFGLDDARAFVETIAPAGWADDSQWIFAVEAEGRYAGNIALRDEGGGRFEVAYGAHPWVRGTGHMTAAVRMLLDWGFTARGVRTVVWRAHVGNWASRRLAWRLGFTVQGTLPAYLPQRGALVNAWVGTLQVTDPRTPRHPWYDAPVVEAPGGGPWRLRPLHLRDVDRIVEACSDPVTQRWLGSTPAPYDATAARTWLESVREKQACGEGTTWAVADTGTDELVGSMSVFDIVTGRDGEIGYWMHPDARGRGAAAAAARLALSWCFGPAALGKVRGVAAAANTASCRTLAAAGMTRGGGERLGTLVRREDGVPERADVAVYDVLAEEWSAAARSDEAPSDRR